MPLHSLIVALLAELTANDIPDPLAQRFTLAATVADLCRLAGEALPDAVAAVLDGDTITLAPTGD